MMVEYLMLPGLALVLAGAVAVQFLMHAVRYGPRSRRRLAWLAVPAAIATVALAVFSPVRYWPSRLAIALPVGALLYLTAAVACVLRWRTRQVTRLVGDVAALRHRLMERRKELDRLFWMSANDAPDGGGAAPVVDRPSRHEWAAVVRQWQRAVPAEVTRRGAQLAEWRAEFARTGLQELRARARVLDAAWRDIPEGEQRQAVRARTAMLWLVHDELEDAQRKVPLAASAARERWEQVREETRRLEEELDQRLRERADLVRHQLPLE